MGECVAGSRVTKITMNQLTKHPGGRPTSYSPSFVAVIEEYLQTVGREQTKLPKRVDIARLLGVHRETLNEWEKEHKEFSDAIKKIDEAQEGQLMDDGMYGGKEVNSAMAIFLLKANHGMIETNRQEITGKDGERIAFTFVKYGDNDPVSIPAARTHVEGAVRPASLPSAQLAPEGTKDNTGSQPTDTTRI